MSFGSTDLAALSCVLITSAGIVTLTLICWTYWIGRRDKGQQVTEAKKPQSPLYSLLNEVNRAATNGLPFLAISMAVALPAICASLAMPTGRSGGVEYKAWCEKNLGPVFSNLTPDDLYSMRCGVLHSGRFGDMKHSVARVIFVPPNVEIGVTDSILNDAYFCSVVDFCRNMTEAVYRWFEANRDDAVIKANIPHLMQYRMGLPPYITGNFKLIA